MDLLLKDFLIVDPVNKKNEVGCIGIENGVIIKVQKVIDEPCKNVIDGKSRLVATPGLMDMHVHFRDPGFTYKEDILTGAKSAAAGGFTAVACMPNTNPPCDNTSVVEYITKKAKGTGVNVYPIGCITMGMKGESLCNYDELKKAGAIAISDDGRPVENAELLRQALEKSNTNGLTVISHCEDLNIINGGIINKGKVSQKLGVRGMDRASEDSITAREIALAMSCDAHIHIAHVSTFGSVQLIRDAKNNGVKVTAETCPHYFTYTQDKLLLKDADYRMSPPLRTEKDRQAVLEAVCDGTIDCIVTDHAPHSAEEKSDFLKAPNGVVGLETSLAVTLTQLYHTGKITLTKLIELMSVNPRKVLSMEESSLSVGQKANITIIDTDKKWTVIPEKLKSKSKNTVFKGEKLTGKVAYTISNGKIIYNDNL